MSAGGLGGDEPPNYNNPLGWPAAPWVLQPYFESRSDSATIGCLRFPPATPPPPGWVNVTQPGLGYFDPTRGEPIPALSGTYLAASATQIFLSLS